MPSIEPNIFTIDRMPYVDSRDIAREFGIRHSRVLERIAEVRSNIPDAASEHFRKRMAVVDGHETHSVAVSYIAFMTMPVPHRRTERTLKALVAYLEAMSAAFDAAGGTIPPLRTLMEGRN
ncbi:hypothetical protein GCM10011390_48600 [Aureimonas endophytica]|uniref:Uncharacterized protein n=1 Tax=Aureimonas endophytica TaxID=2027858 RepID=A0A917A2I6_9HYPH|nr:hypothetical protein [Aureimonas endophytica]GGE23472.1 hypothetical protein GCM10011390_48600 [Aureimonas endophytica]